MHKIRSKDQKLRSIAQRLVSNLSGSTRKITKGQNNG